MPTGRVEISAHNHNFAVDPKTLPTEVEITHINLNDQCCEGLRHKYVAVMSVQYHPEAAPGPHAHDDGGQIHMAAIRYGIPLLTTLSAAQAAVSGIRVIRDRKLKVRSLQEHYEANQDHLHSH